MSGLVCLPALEQALGDHRLRRWYAPLAEVCKNAGASRHGKLAQWSNAVDELPACPVASLDLATGVKVGADISPRQRDGLKQQLLALSPWRKGPFDLFGLHLDTEWRSDWKWQRIAPHIDLQGKTILDVGCGNGYYMFRMLGAGSGFVLGIDPVALYVMQFKAINKYVNSSQLQLLPLSLEELPEMAVFDTVFSMGVLYHRRLPQVHLQQLKNHLKPGGELVLETLVIESTAEDILVPDQRYAGMRNVWTIPSVSLLSKWCAEGGFSDIQLLDCQATSLEEQRRTEWMTTWSLEQFLDPADQRLTIEGHPAPMRAVVKCRA